MVCAANMQEAVTPGMVGLRASMVSGSWKRNTGRCHSAVENSWGRVSWGEEDETVELT